MGLLSWFNRETRPVVRIEGNGEYKFEIVGESHYQDALDRICGGKCEEGHTLEAEATLHLEDNNEYDNQAVAVLIEGQKVGHLARRHARQFRNQLSDLGYGDSDAVVDAKIVGGWAHEYDEGDYGVKLDMPTK